LKLIDEGCDSSSGDEITNFIPSKLPVIKARKKKITNSEKKPVLTSAQINT